ncbi:MAG: hypothetical protein ACYC3X_24675 [Pirellulaceae bacterium]
MAERQRQVADLTNRGLCAAEIAHTLQVDRATVARDLKVLEQIWHEHALQDWRTIRDREMAKLEQVRDAAWLAFQTVQNCHGEAHLNRYLTIYLRTSELLARLQQLYARGASALPAADPQQRDVHLQFIEIRSREELEDFQRFEAATADRYKALVERTLSGGESDAPDFDEQ